MEDANFYSQIAASMADNSFDDSDEDEPKPTHNETKQLAQSVDVDDLDANLFGSFSQSQNQRRNSRSRNKSSNPPKIESTAGKGKPSETVKKEKDIGVPTDVKAGKDVKNSATKATENKKSKLDFDDDLLDLLSDSEEIVPKKRTKPTIQLTTKPKQQSSKSDGKPITSQTDDNSLAGLELERPGTSRGNPITKDTVSMESTSAPKKESRVNILRVDAPDLVSDKNVKGDSMKNKPVVNFDGDDDILGDMGFDDSSTHTSNRSSSRTSTTTSRLDDLLGTKKPQTNTVTGSLSKASKPNTASSTEDSGFQFGNYVPSSIDTSTDSPRRGMRLPAGRRRGSSELDTSITLRPSSAPSPVKKSVHFAEKLESNERPSSSPLTSDPKRPSIKTEKIPLTTDKQVTKQITGVSGGPRSRKPPRPTKTEEGPSNGVRGDGNELETQGDDMVLDDSLFPSNESTPKHSSSSRGRRRPASSATDSLFEDNQSQQDQDMTLENMGILSPREPTKLKKDSLKDETLEDPVFPWQKPKPVHSTKKRNNSSTVASSIDTPNTSQQQKPSSVPVITADISLDQSSKLVSFQEQLLQQQKLMQEQLASFQAQSSGAVAAVKASSNAEVEKLQGELKDTVGKFKELEETVEKKSVELNDKQKTVSDLELQLQSSKENSLRFEDQGREAAEKVTSLDKELAQVKLELTSQVDDLKMKLYKIELERDQMQHTIESTKNRHAEEVEAIQKSHESRVKAVEESFQRREMRWREETETDTLRFQDKLTQLEQEKTDAVLAVKKKLDVLEVNKTNEIGRLQDMHYSTVEDLKREHELDKQHLLSMHRQELEAIKAAHSHTRMLSELSHKVESSSRDVSHLQAKLEHAHSTELDERTQRVKSHEDHLKTLEAQLMRQKAENDSERDRLQSLIAKMESHVSQQKKQTDRDRWQLQQDIARHTAQQSAFEEERMSSLTRLETERENLQHAKEKFLAEQQEILSKCYEERRSLASERAELSVLQKRALEREQKDQQLKLKSEAERQVTQAHLRDESDRVMTEGAQFRQDQEKLRLEREAIDRDREKLEAFGAEIQQRSREIEEITETAMLVREKGDLSLAESQRLQEELAEQTSAIQAQRDELSEKEKLLAVEQLSLAQERRKLQHLKVMSLSTPLPDVPSLDSMEERTQLSQTSAQVLGHHESIQSFSNTSLSSLKGGSSEGILPLTARSSYSPRASPVHVSSFAKPSNVKSLLAKIDHSRSLRQMVLDAKQDDEYLEKETNFLQSLHTNPYIY